MTSISRDHTEFLGKYLRQIIKEKLALLRKDAALVYSVRTHYLKNLVEEYCLDICPKDVFFIDPCLERNKSFQQRNWSLAKKCMEYLYGERSGRVDQDNKKTFGESSVHKVG